MSILSRIRQPDTMAAPAHLTTPQFQRKKSRLSRREGIVLAVTLGAGAALRVVLAARGWPYANSDEATIGLMADDILWHGARPAFTYGEHHVGAIDAYLQAPFYALFGPTNLAMHLATTVMILGFLAVLFAFTRQIWSPLVACLTVAWMALGPGQALFFGLRSGSYAQDMLLFGMALLWLATQRLRRPAARWRRMALAGAIGLACGVALWSTPLMLPFVVAALIALGMEALRGIPWGRAPDRMRALAGETALLLGGIALGMLPFLVTFVTTRGQVLVEALRTSQAQRGAPLPANGLAGFFVAALQQLGGTFFISIPSLMGSQTVCTHCAFWPYPVIQGTFAANVLAALVAAPFAALAVLGWLLAAQRLLGRMRQSLHQRRPGVVPSLTGDLAPEIWWGRAMPVIGGALTVLLYAGSRSSFAFSDTSVRYITSLYLCAPLVIAPLAGGIQQAWGWSVARLRQAPAHLPGWRAFLASGIFLALIAIAILGAGEALAQSSVTARYGVPAGQRDMQVIAFLESRHATRFNTTWWVCYRLMFASAEHVDCAIMSDTNPFAPGNFNRVPAYARAVAATAHPAYVFDLTTNEADPRMIAEVTALARAGVPPFTGYAIARVAGYVVFYHQG